MNPRTTPDEILAATQMHLDILDAFIGVVEDKLGVPMTPFVRDSLMDLLGNLTEQRDTYTVLAAGEALVA